MPLRTTDLNSGKDPTQHPFRLMPSNRSDAIDVLKGLGILFVVTNHCFARGSRKFLGMEVTDSIGLYSINRAIHFAVPMFLFVSCVLLAKSLSKEYDLKKYAMARWRKTIVPYLFASFAYFLLVQRSMTPVWTHLADLFHQVLYGKAYFHLYFTIVLVQVSLLVPILVKLLRNRKLPWLWVALTSIAVQFLIFTLQRTTFEFDRPGSIFLWYLIPILLGAALGASCFSAEDLSKDLKGLIGGTLVALVVYVVSSVAPLLTWGTSSDLINGSYAIFTAGLALWLWSAAPSHPQGWIRSAFVALGRVSLPLFLVHPAIMHFLGGPRVTEWFGTGWGSLAAYWIATLGVSYLLALAGMRMRPIRWILGESSPSRRGPISTPTLGA